LLVALLGGVFLKGFKEAIGSVVTLVGVYLTLNLIVVAIGKSIPVPYSLMFLAAKVMLLQ